PAANFTGTVSAAATFRAWDQTAGTAGTKVDTTANGGGTAFSSATVSAAITVNPSADTPSVTNATTNQDTQTTSGLVVTRNWADGAEVTYFKVTNIKNGTLFLSDGTTPVSANTFVSFGSGTVSLKFTPATDLNGSVPATPFSFDVQAATGSSDALLGGGVV